MEYAFWLAKRLGGHVIAAHVSDVRQFEWPLLADISGSIGAQPYQAVLPHIQQYQKDKAGVILESVKETARRRGVACATLHKTGTLTETILEEETNADLVVLGQRGEHAEQTGEMMGSSVERIVRRSVKPCLVTPGKFHEISQLLIAHDGSLHSNKSLSAGLDLASALGLPVAIVTVAGDDSMASSTHLEEAVTLARKQGVEFRSQLLKGDAEAEILKFAEEQKTDLIVMGAYGHSRIREFILGSTTSHVIRKSKVPVLLTR
jgi:nucleotide-binding universal stress UspA family protein